MTRPMTTRRSPPTMLATRATMQPTRPPTSSLTTRLLFSFCSTYGLKFNGKYRRKGEKGTRRQREIGLKGGGQTSVAMTTAIRQSAIKMYFIIFGGVNLLLLLCYLVVQCFAEGELGF
jgi:hypothetical protein